MTEPQDVLAELERADPFMPHDLGCRCYPHVSQRAAIEAATQAATAEYRAALVRTPETLPRKTITLADSEDHPDDTNDWFGASPDPREVHPGHYPGNTYIACDSQTVQDCVTCGSRWPCITAYTRMHDAALVRTPETLYICPECDHVGEPKDHNVHGVRTPETLDVAGLRREIEALLGVALMVERDALHYEETFVQRSAVLAIVDRLADAPASTLRRLDDAQVADTEVIEWLREALGMDEQWAEIARGIVVLKRALAE